MNITAQIINSIGTITNMVGINIKNKLKCLICFTIGNLLVATSLGILNATSGMIVQLIFVIETLINFFLERKNENFKYPIWLIAIYIIVPCIINAFNFSTGWDILAMVAAVAFPLAMLTKDTSLRVLNLISVIVWVPYNFVFGQYAGTIGCAIFTIINFIAIIRYDILKK